MSMNRLSLHCDRIHIINKKNYGKKYIIISKNYHTDLIEILKYIPSEYESMNFAILFGDTRYNGTDVVFTKAKEINDVTPDSCIVFNSTRHYSNYLFNEAHKNRGTFKNKIPKAVWRGATTGTLDMPNNQRLKLVSTWIDANDIADVGFTRLVPGYKNVHKYAKHLLSISQMSKYKYIIMLEGNDVSSGLKWALYSGSIVMMPEPKCETIFGEGSLIKYVHYIPLKDDTSDLADQIIFCENNVELCEQIIQNANKYVDEFRSKNWYQISANKIIDHFKLNVNNDAI